jgi:type VI secretion system secreted protein Hcp
MPQSDAYMELSDPAVWGETYDEQFGMGEKGRKLGAFEISNLKFGVTCTPKDPSGANPGAAPKTAAAAGSDKGSAAIEEPTIGTFTITKYIDKGSPDLFLACLKKDQIKWAIISIRETGEVNRKPYLVLEFTKLTVDSFQWDLNPGDSEGAATMESVEFSFQTILIKYARQEKGGEHQVVKMKGWNRELHNEQVSELDAELQASMQADAY